MYDPQHVEATLQSFADKYGMSKEALVSYLTFGNPRHPDAPDEVCGEASPRFPTQWCGRAPHTDGDHIPSVESVFSTGENRPMNNRTPDTLLGVAIPSGPRRHPRASIHVCAYPDPDHPDRWCVREPHAKDAHTYGEGRQV